MKRRVWPAVFAIVVGVSMVVQWTLSFAGGGVPEVDTRPVELVFHLTAEALTAALLVIAGVALLKGASWARWVYAVAVGMLVYTAIVSPGYFLQEGQAAFLVLFGAVLVLAVLCLAAVVRGGAEED